MTTRPQFGFVVEYVKDIEGARRFYEHVLGLQVQRYHPTFVQFDRFAIASDEPMGGKGEPEVYWLVDDADAAYADLAPKAKVTMEPSQVPFGKVFAVEDPDGRQRFLLELAKDRPSQAVD